MTYKNPGSVNRHLGGRKAARTRDTNDHIRQFGYPTYNDSDAQQKRMSRPLRKESRAIQPTPKIVNGKQICPVCQEPVSIWGFSAHYNMKHTARNIFGGTVNDNPAANKPTTGIRANEEPAPTIPTNNNNITSQSAPHQNCVKTQKFKTGDQVMLNGFRKCTIRGDSLQREIVGAVKMSSGWFYKVTTGTNTTGNSYHCYPEKRLTMIDSIGAGHPSPNNEVAAAPPTPSPNPQPTILAFPFPNIRTRRYTKHQKSTRLSCRKRNNSPLLRTSVRGVRLGVGSINQN